MEYTAPKIRIAGFAESIITGVSGGTYLADDSNPVILKTKMAENNDILSDTITTVNIANMAL